VQTLVHSGKGNMRQMSLNINVNAMELDKQLV
jgi:hypothetical protein